MPAIELELAGGDVTDRQRTTTNFPKGGSIVSEEKRSEPTSSDSEDKASEAERKSTQSGPKFTESPDPMSSVRKATGDAWKSTEGKTVSMRVYIGSIAAVIVLMLLARCGG